MQYSDTTNKNGIIQREESLCNLGDGKISGNSTLLKQFTALNNQVFFKIWSEGMSVDKNWKLDDYNPQSGLSVTDIPDAPITLVAGQADYTIPVAYTGANVASFLRMNGIYYTVGTERIYLLPMLLEDTYSTQNGIPTKYRMNGKSLRFNCPPSDTFVADHPTFHEEFQRTPDPFTSSDTTQEAGIPQTHHELIPLGASALFLLPTQPQLAQLYESRFLSGLELFKRDIANMNDDAPRRLTPSVISCE